MVYDNVPGTRVSFRDGGLALTAPAPGTKVTLLGVSTSANLTLNEPTLFEKKNEAIALSRNSDASISELSIAVAEAFDGGATLVEVVKVADVSGGLSKAARLAALDITYAQLLNSPTDIVVPVGVYVDDAVITGVSPSGDFGRQLAKYCYDSTDVNDTTVGVIAVRPPLKVANDAVPASADELFGTPTLTQMNTWEAALSNFTQFAYFDGTGVNGVDGSNRPTSYEYWATADGDPDTITGAVLDGNQWPIDMGAYISVIASPLRLNSSLARSEYPQNGFYNSAGAAYYAGFMTQLLSESAPTNKVIGGGVTAQRNLSLTQVDNLIGARYVTIQTKVRGAVWGAAVTAAWNTSAYYRSDYVNLTTVRTVHEVADIIRLVADPLIGEPATPANRNAMDNRIDRALAIMVERGALLSYNYALSQTASQRTLGILDVDVTLQLPGELRRVNTVIGLTK